MFGPRLGDLSQQGASYGSVIPRVYGSVAMMGNVFWIENNSLKETSKTTDSGGKGGGGGPSTTTYLYSATFALGLCEGPIAGVRRIWISGKLFYDAGAGDISTIIASNRAAALFTIHDGSETQLPDARMQATLGVANTPAFRGLAYIVFNDLPLEDYGNTLMGAQVKVEVMSTTSGATLTEVISGPYTTPHPNTGFPPEPVYVGADKVTFIAPQWANEFPASSLFRIYDIYPDGTIIHDSVYWVPGTGVPPHQNLSKGDFLYNAAQVFFGGNFDGSSGYISGRDDLYAGLSNIDPLGASAKTIFASSGISTYQRAIAADATDAAILCDGEFIYVSGSASTRKYDSDLNLIATGVGLAGQTLPVSRLAIDEQSGLLVGIPIFNSTASVYQWSADLSTVTAIATGLDITNGYYSNAFYVSGNLLINTWSDTTAQTLNVRYFSLSSQTNAPVQLGDIVLAEIARSNLIDPSEVDVTTLTDQVRGYRVTSIAAIRAGLEPMQGAWPFDVVQSGYGLKFIRRGVNASVALINESELDARNAGSAAGVVITKSREMDTQLPYRVDINHLDFDREYDVDGQYAERLNTDSVNVTTIEMPIVLTAAEAAQKAEILLYMYWLERHDISFNLPPTYNQLEPGDIITIVATAGTYVLRLTSVNTNSDGVIECQAKFNNAAGYSSTATGATSGAFPLSTIPIKGPSIYKLLDIPCLKDIYSLPGFVVAMCGALGSWPGGTLFKSQDGGQTWDDTNTFFTPSMIGYTADVVAAPATFALIDTTTVINAVFYDLAPSSCTEAQLLNGANHFAFGTDGRWEIIAAKTCVLQPDGSYNLSDLLRGRFGTEASASLHAQLDSLVWLNDKFLQFSSMSTNQIGQQSTYRAITRGEAFTSDLNAPFTYRGVNLKCLSPIYALGSVNPSTSDWSIAWQRRTRVGGDWLDLVDASLGETTEAYEVDIYTDSTYTTVKRTISASSPAITYTLAQQTADFGAAQAVLNLKIYQLSATTGRGYPLQKMLVKAVDFYAMTMAILHFEGTVGASTFTDVKGHSFTGSATLTASNVVFGATACQFSGAQVVNFPTHADFASIGDFTLEYWFTGNAAVNCQWSQAGASYWYGSQIALGSSVRNLTMTGFPSSGKHHYALSRTGSTVRFFVDGMLWESWTNANTFTLSGAALGYYQISGNSWITGVMDEFRFTKACRYTENFTVPAYSFGDN